MSSRKKLLWGVCGVGCGHAYRQLPLLNHFAVRHRIVIFAYGNSLRIYSQAFKNRKNVTVLEVAPPYWMDGEYGIGFRETAGLAKNMEQDSLTINCEALARAGELIGRPDLVISDYEPTSAQYAYAYDAPLVTLDQQSKYLCDGFPEKLDGTDRSSEVMRLNMFFPKAEARLACSFFRPKGKNNRSDIRLFPPILRNEILDLKKLKGSHKDTITVYLSAFPDYPGALATLDEVARRNSRFRFKVFAEGISKNANKTQKNLKLHEPGGTEFLEALNHSCAVICTSGHSMISEALYLGLPIFAVPRHQYEALLCAKIIADNGFGATSKKLEADELQDFLDKLPRFRQNIDLDERILLRGDGKDELLGFLEESLKTQQAPKGLCRKEAVRRAETSCVA